VIQLGSGVSAIPQAFISVREFQAALPLLDGRSERIVYLGRVMARFEGQRDCVGALGFAHPRSPA
jgi:hypothetical protein